jgi:peptidoglycan/LPS O-acetylase OafA/YrhL
MTRIPTLDGWRGLAILLVLFDHTQTSLLNHYFQPFTQTGGHGVTIFFVLSGFLITSKLIESPIDLKRFYIRRFFRLMPAAWTYLAVVLLLGLLTGVHLENLAGFSSCIFFYRNFEGLGAGALTGHFWSLSLEEQFYLVWPCLLLLAGVRRCRWIAVAGAVGCAVYRWFFWAHYDRIILSGQTQVRADALLVGCVLAMLLADPRIRRNAEQWSKFLAVPAIAAFLFSIAQYHWIFPLFESVAIACLIAATTLHPASNFSRWLSFAPLAWLGAISYSLYIWQQLFMAFHSPWAMCVFLPLAALVSYYLIERPATQWGHRLASSRARNMQGMNPVVAFAEPSAVIETALG